MVNYGLGNYIQKDYSSINMKTSDVKEIKKSIHDILQKTDLSKKFNANMINSNFDK